MSTYLRDTTLVGRSSAIRLGFQNQELTLRAESNPTSQTARQPFMSEISHKILFWSRLPLLLNGWRARLF
jgi:hypothetical protein